MKPALEQAKAAADTANAVSAAMESVERRGGDVSAIMSGALAAMTMFLVERRNPGVSNAALAETLCQSITKNFSLLKEGDRAAH